MTALKQLSRTLHEAFATQFQVPGQICENLGIFEAEAKNPKFRLEFSQFSCRPVFTQFPHTKRWDAETHLNDDALN